MSYREWDTGRLRMSGLEQGDGQLVVLLHGFPTYHKTWEDYLEPLSRDFKVVVPDLRGYYRSDKPQGVSSYTIEELTEDILSLVHHLGYQRVRLVGHDWGGALAWSIASRATPVHKVAVFNCPHPEAMAWHLRKNPRQMRRSWYIFFFQIPWLPEFLIRRFPDRFVKAAFRARRGTFTDQDLAEYRDALMMPGVVQAGLNYYRASFREALRGEVPSMPIFCPALLLWGERDSALGIELTHNMDRYFHGPYECRVFPDAGHWSPNDLGEEGVSLIAEFLKD